MLFHIGDKVIHLSHGLGEIVAIENKIINDLPTTCYVFRSSELTIWIPVDDSHNHSLRFPTPPDEFRQSFGILTSPTEPLPDDRLLRRNRLLSEMHGGELPSICHVVRSLTDFMHTSRLNDQERAILQRATQSILTEWTYSLGIPLSQAQKSMEKLLAG